MASWYGHGSLEYGLYFSAEKSPSRYRDLEDGLKHHPSETAPSRLRGPLEIHAHTTTYLVANLVLLVLNLNGFLIQFMQ